MPTKVTEETKQYIRKEVRENLEGHAYDCLELETDEEIKNFIESQKDNIEKVLANCLNLEVYTMMKDEGYKDINEYILTMPGDFFRECMCGVGIPGWDTVPNEETETNQDKEPMINSGLVPVRINYRN